jgi:DNA repair protein SbcD/Mre11
MTSVKFIHTADLHLDTPFKGLSSWNEDLSKKLKDATFQSFRRIVQLCLDNKVDFLIISGDVFDSENKSLASQLRFFPELKKLSDSGISTYIVCGNHDPHSSWINLSHLPDKVYCFDPASCGYTTFNKDNVPVADIHGISFGESSVKLNLAKKYKLSPSPSPVSIAVLHGVIGEPGPHIEYAPFKVEDILDKGFDYWALGHIHKTKIIRSDKPAVAYPGNPQGRDFGETGIKGCFLVSIRENQNPRIELLPTQLIRFENLSVDLTGVVRVEELVARIGDAIRSIEGYQENINLVLRVDLHGHTDIHEQLKSEAEANAILEQLNEGQLSQSWFVWIDRLSVNTRPNIDLEGLKNRADFPAEVIRTFEKILSDNSEIEALFKLLEAECTNAQVKKNAAARISDDTKIMLIEKARTILIDHLTDVK